jgi:hypothetical protein
VPFTENRKSSQYKTAKFILPTKDIFKGGGGYLSPVISFPSHFNNNKGISTLKKQVQVEYL